MYEESQHNYTEMLALQNHIRLLLQNRALLYQRTQILSIHHICVDGYDATGFMGAATASNAVQPHDGTYAISIYGETADDAAAPSPATEGSATLAQRRPLLSQVHRTRAELARLFTYVPPTWLQNVNMGDDQLQATGAGGPASDSTHGIPPLPHVSAGDATSLVRVQAALDTLRRALQIECLLQLQRHIRAVGK